MQKVRAAYPIGTVIASHYLVENILAKNSFSTLYRVKDQRVVSREPINGQFYALKELMVEDEQERERFIFECEVLKQLDHLTLPRVHRVFEDEQAKRVYMLMDFVEGPDLEELGKQQPRKRFALPQVIAIMAPIVDAVSYLHTQQPPITHRAIRPANIVMPPNRNRAMLLDFGIVDEYVSHGMPHTERQCSPGYTAPEQYRGSTCLQSDIYGLGATFYTLLTGTVPVDALERLVQLKSTYRDPLVPVNQLVPSIPGNIAETIHRAMSIRSADRFPTVEAFRKSLTVYAPLRAPFEHSDVPLTTPPELFKSPHEKRNDGMATARDRHYYTPLPAEPIVYSSGAMVSGGHSPGGELLNSPASKLPMVPATPPVLPVAARRKAAYATPIPIHLRKQWRVPCIRKPGIIVLATLLVLIVMGVGLARSVFSMSYHSTGSSSAAATPVFVHAVPAAKPTKLPTPELTKVPVSRATSTVYSTLAMSYNGTIHDLLTNVTASMTLTKIQQSDERFQGYFAGQSMQGSFTGVLDTSKHIFFTVMGLAGQPPLFFEGAMQNDGNIAGNYCSMDQAGQCAGSYGIWSIAPVP